MSLDWSNAILAEGCKLIEDDEEPEKGEAETEEQPSTLNTRALKTRGMTASCKIGINVGGITGYVKSEIKDIQIAVNGYKTLDDIGASVLFNGFKINTADVKLIGELSASVKYKFSNPDNKPLPVKTHFLASVPAFGGLGTGVYFQVFLVNKGSGEVGVTWKCDVDQTIHYDAKKGFSQIPGKMANTRAEIKAKTEIKVGVDAEFNIQALTIRLANVGVGTGMKGAYSHTLKDNPSMVCDEVGAHFYLEVFAELLTDIDHVDLSAEWSIFNETNSPIRATVHFDNGEFVGSRCTWKPASSVTVAPESDFKYTIENGGAYAEYIGKGGNVVVPQKLGGVDVVDLRIVDRYNTFTLNINKLDLSRCTGLRFFGTDSVNISSIDFTNCTNLDYLDIGTIRKTTSLDIRPCTNLVFFSIADNFHIKSVYASGLKKLRQVSVVGCHYLEYLDVSGCTSLSVLDYPSGATVKR